MKKRLFILSVLSVFLILTLIFTSCGDKNANENNNKNEDLKLNETENKNDENSNQSETLIDDYIFPELNCGGDIFNLLNVTTTWDFYTVIVHESQTGEILDDTIYKRNLTVEEKFNVKLKETGVLIDQIEAQIKKTIMAGDAEYDMAYCPTYCNSPIGALITQNLFYDLNEIPELQLDKPWWNQAVNQECVIGAGQKLYFTCCDINIMNLQAPWCVYINEDMMKNLGLDLPYNLVKAGQWTIDKFFEYAKAGAQLNGEDSFPTSMAKWTPNNAAIYGYCSYEGGTRALVIGTGEKFISRDSDGMPYLSIETQRFYDICDKIVEITKPDGIYQNANDYNSGGFHFEYLFRDSKCLMSVAEIKASETFREMDDTFGIVPIPKYDENQDNYYSSVARQMPVLVVPNTVADTQRTGIILDAMAYLSTRDVTPVFFDVTMSQKRLRNEESIEMLQIIKDSVIYDVGTAYGWSSDIYVSITDALDKGTNSAASQIEKQRDKVETKIEKTMELMD
ncbi:MAG: extracellular solute-binding protein [Oscillospiraceae bacterium]|nr:extracellular solute-binding protein [Oscillospiraceae bacterium]